VDESGQTSDHELLPDRACGACNVCCVALTIDDPALRKPQGYRCRNARADNSCAIYETRPQTCRTFFCGWRQLKWVRETLRPDRSSVLVRLHGEIGEDGGKRLGVAITLLTKAALKAEGLAETVAAAVSAGIPTYLHVPGPPGYTAAMGRINEAVADAVLARDKAELLATLRKARAKAAAAKFVPVVLGE
jgi:hypothetical protein